MPERERKGSTRPGTSFDTRCCDDYKCRRKKPVLVRRSGLTERWYVITDYKDEGNGIISATIRHDITDDFEEYLRRQGYVKVPSDE